MTVALMLIVLAGGGLIWRTVLQTDREMREQLLQQTRMLAQAVPAERIKTLTGSEADLSGSIYQRLKDQLSLVRSTIPLCQSVALLGLNADGKLFYLLNSESVASKNYRKPGEIYKEAPAGQYRAFATRTEVVEGPYTDQLGKWVSGVVPILDSKTAQYSLPTPEDAKALVGRAVDFYSKNGKESLLKEMQKPHGEFCKGPDLYVFAYDMTMTWLAHPMNPERVGQNWIDRKDWSGGKYFRREIQQVALSPKGRGWVEYEYVNALNGQRDLKTTYVEKVDNMIVCAGAYKGDGNLLALLSLNVDADSWNWNLAKAALPMLLLTLFLALILLTVMPLLERRARLGGGAPPWMRRLEPALAASIGVVLTLFEVGTVYKHQIENRALVFKNMAAERTRMITETMRNVPLAQLEVFSHFYEKNAYISEDEFQKFITYQMNNPAIQAWEWISAIPAEEKQGFEEAVRARGTTEFEIWQKDEKGKRVPASGRDVYYPVTQVMPLLVNAPALGYDLGSERIRRKALEDALLSGLPTGTDPITLVQERSRQKGMLICRPVFSKETPKHLRGYVLVVIRMGTLLKLVGADRSIDLDLSILKKDGPSESMAVSWNTDNPPNLTLYLKRPLFAFGKVFTLTVYAGPNFLSLYHPVRESVWVGLTGLLLTYGLVVLIGLLFQRREELERLVFDRTAELHLQADALNAAANAIVITDNKGIIKWVNHAFTRFTGYSAAEAIGNTPSVLKSGQHDSAFYKNLWKTVLTGEVWQGEMMNRRKDGVVYTEEMTITPIKNDRGMITHFIAVKQDITAKKQVEAELHRVEVDLRNSQKMESVGHLAAGMAHEINTPLQAMHSNVQFLEDAFLSLTEWRQQVQEIQRGNLHASAAAALEEVEKKADLDYLLSEIPQAIKQSEEAMDRVSEIVLAMKEFSRPGEVTQTRIDLNQAISSTLTVCRNEWSQIAELVTSFDQELPSVTCVVSEINQVLLQLVINATHAIGVSAGNSLNQNGGEFSKKGTITVTTRREGNWAEVRVSDTGSGMSEEVKSHVFDPFYTTKEVGKGTGLGLLIAYTIIEKKHGGKIGFESEAGKGTTFFFRLPLKS